MNATPLTSTARRTRGMTLTEVMIGACVLALVLGGALLVMQRNYRLLAAARDINLATQMLQNEVEHMRLASWSTVSGYATEATTLPLDAAFANHPQVRNRFTLTRAKTSVRADLFELTYTIRWTGSDGQTVSRSLRTGYAQNGLYDWYYSGI